MAEFLTTNGVSFNIERIISSARQHLVLISPYFRLSKNLTERLRDADARGIKTILVYGKRALDPEDQAAIASLKNLTIYFFENLHAKCYFNESLMIITSMNLYEFSEKTNREMGILLNANEDAYLQAANEARSIIASATRQTASSLSAPPTRQTQQGQVRVRPQPSRRSGACIRCGREIAWNPDSPLCRSCFSVWAQYEDPDYEEDFCHTCGRHADTSMARPECYSCYSR